MRRRHRSNSKPDPSVVDEALNGMAAEELRALVREILPWLDDKTRWLGSSDSKAVLKKRASAAIQVCPKESSLCRLN